MSFIISLIDVGLIGGGLSMVMKRPEGMIMNIALGIVGSMLGGWLISPLLGAGTINQNDFSLAVLFASFLGAVILLAIVNFWTTGKTRT